MPKTIDSVFRTAITGEVLSLTRLVEIQRRDGVVFYFTSLDVDFVSGNGHTYKALGGFLDSAITSDPNMTVSNMELTGMLNNTDFTIDDCRSGIFFGAEIRFFTGNWALQIGTTPVKIISGHIGEMTVYPSGLVMAELRSLKQLYQRTIGDAYSQTCRVDLGSTKCGVDLTPFTVEGAVSLLASGDVFNVAIDGGTPPEAIDEWFQFGVLTWVTGLNTGRNMEIKGWSQSTTTIALYIPMHNAIGLGDRVSMYPGCDKTAFSVNGCKVKFNNLINMRAELYVPGPDALLQSPSTATSVAPDTGAGSTDLGPWFNGSGGDGG